MPLTDGLGVRKRHNLRYRSVLRLLRQPVSDYAVIRQLRDLGGSSDGDYLLVLVYARALGFTRAKGREDPECHLTPSWSRARRPNPRAGVQTGADGPEFG
jgi:hypothetical protein